MSVVAAMPAVSVSRSAAAFAAALSALAVAPATSAAPSPRALLARYQPVAVMHPDEFFRPAAVEPFLAKSVLQVRRPDGSWATVETAPGQLPTADPPGCTTAPGRPCWRLDQARCTAAQGVASISCYAAGAGGPSVVYGAVHRRRTRIALQYWYWYEYNFWSGSHPPTDYVWQAHEGDWEVVTVVLTRAGKPLFVGYSQHSCGKRRPWSRVRRWRRTHPVVYVAVGSHANYFSAGTQPMDLRPGCYPAAAAAVLRAYLPAVLEHTGEGARLGPAGARTVRTRLVRISARTPSWMAYAGMWGEANLFHVPANTFPGPAPEGPAFHDIWRNPIGVPAGWPQG